jgi:hypothetical protein
MAATTLIDTARGPKMAERTHHWGTKGRLSAETRREMPSGEFALPGHGEGRGGKGAGAYPIDTEARARNALARGAQHASPSELATIKRKVHAKYPDIEIGGEKKESAADRRYGRR